MKKTLLFLTCLSSLNLFAGDDTKNILDYVDPFVGTGFHGHTYTKNILDYVDPFVGTGFHGHTYPGATLPFGAVQLSPDTRRGDWDACSGYHYSDSTLLGFVGTGFHGHTYPGATLPFGAVQLSPDTRRGDWDACSGYHYSDSTLLGFSHTHLTGTGCIDLGDLLLRPTLSPAKEGKQLYKPTRFFHSSEKAAPGYYSVRLEDEGIQAELTATTYAGMHRYTFPMGTEA